MYYWPSPKPQRGIAEKEANQILARLNRQNLMPYLWNRCEKVVKILLIPVYLVTKIWHTTLCAKKNNI